MSELIHGDCLRLMKDIPNKSINMILCDLPYGTTNCEWDSIIDLPSLWEQYTRIITDNGAIVLTASQPFTTHLIMSNLPMFKYEWVWEKSRATGHVHSKNKPMKSHENVLVFSTGTTVHVNQSKNRMTYNPQGLIELKTPLLRKSGGSSDAVMSQRKSHRDTLRTVTNYPKSVLKFASESNTIHPTQKPVALFEYLIKTYTDEHDTVLDNCAGSGTTAIAAINANRQYICMEKDDNYFSIMKKRVEEYAN